MKENRKIELKEMQDMFCDYAFNRLSDEERIVFEQNLPRFPELQLELNEVSHVFKKVEKIDFNKQISSRTRNLSVKVNERFAKESKFSNRRKIISKYLIPVVGLAIIIVVIVSGNIDFNKEKEINADVRNENFVGITSAEAKSVFDNDYEIIELASNLSNGLNSKSLENLAYFAQESIDESYNLTLDEFVKPDDLLNDKSNYHLNSTNEYQIYNQLENLNEEEFQKLLEELEDADFNS